MSHRHGTPWISGAYVYGDGGLGVLAETIPSSGDYGPPYAYNDLSFPADNGKEICGRIATWPSAGTLVPQEDTAFSFSGAPDGSYSFTYDLLVDGVSPGTGTVYLQVGVAGSNINATTGNATFSGASYVAPASQITATTGGATFSGLSSGGVCSAWIHATLDDAVFSGGCSVSANCRISAITGAAVFFGSAFSDGVSAPVEVVALSSRMRTTVALSSRIL